VPRRLVRHRPTGRGEHRSERGGIRAADIGSATYKDAQQNFTDIAQAIRTFQPDSVLVAGFQESAAVIQAMQAAGITFDQT